MAMVLAGDVTSGGSSPVGGVGHSASTGLAGAGGRSLSTGITQVDGPVPLSCRVVKRLEWVGAFGWTIGSAWRLRYGRDVVFGCSVPGHRCLAGRTVPCPHTERGETKGREELQAPGSIRAFFQVMDAG